MYVCHLIQEQVYYLQSEVLTFCCTQRLIKTSAIDHAISVLMGVKVSKVHDCIPIAHRDSQNFFRNADSKQYIVEGALSIEVKLHLCDFMLCVVAMREAGRLYRAGSIKEAVMQTPIIVCQRQNCCVTSRG
jgi:hypothetical protein